MPVIREGSKSFSSNDTDSSHCSHSKSNMAKQNQHRRSFYSKHILAGVQGELTTCPRTLGTLHRKALT